MKRITKTYYVAFTLNKELIDKSIKLHEIDECYVFFHILAIYVNSSSKHLLYDLCRVVENFSRKLII